MPDYADSLANETLQRFVGGQFYFEEEEFHFVLHGHIRSIDIHGKDLVMTFDQAEVKGTSRTQRYKEGEPFTLKNFTSLMISPTPETRITLVQHFGKLQFVRLLLPGDQYFRTDLIAAA